MERGMSSDAWAREDVLESNNLGLNRGHVRGRGT